MTSLLEQKEERRVELQRMNVNQLDVICKNKVPQSEWGKGMIMGILNFEYPDLKALPQTGAGPVAS
jgi:hypothetical protein